MDNLLKSELLLDELAKALVEQDEKQAFKIYQEYKKLYEKITGEIKYTLTSNKVK